MVRTPPRPDNAAPADDPTHPPLSRFNLSRLRPAALEIAIELARCPDGPLILDACGLGPDVRSEYLAAALAERARREGRAA